MSSPGEREAVRFCDLALDLGPAHERKRASLERLIRGSFHLESSLNRIRRTWRYA